MIGILRTLTAVAIGVVTLVGADAAAQSDTRWTAPSGAWSIDYVSQDWTFADPLPPDLQRFAIIMIPVEAPPDSEVRMCAVMETVIGADPDAARVRSSASRLDTAVAEGLFGPRNQAVTGIAFTEINGVSVADVSTRSLRGDSLHLHRVFYLPIDGRVNFVEIDCLWAGTLDPIKAAEIPAVLSTISMTATSEAP